jgi:hypothetical protein
MKSSDVYLLAAVVSVFFSIMGCESMMWVSASGQGDQLVKEYKLSNMSHRNKSGTSEGDYSANISLAIRLQKYVETIEWIIQLSITNDSTFETSNSYISLEADGLGDDFFLQGGGDMELSRTYRQVLDSINGDTTFFHLESDQHSEADLSYTMDRGDLERLLQADTIQLYIHGFFITITDTDKLRELNDKVKADPLWTTTRLSPKDSLTGSNPLTRDQVIKDPTILLGRCLDANNMNVIDSLGSKDVHKSGASKSISLRDYFEIKAEDQIIMRAGYRDLPMSRLIFADFPHFVTKNNVTVFDGGVEGQFHWYSPQKIAKDFVAQVSVKWEGGQIDKGFGIAFRASEDDRYSYYTFEITQDGYYCLARNVDHKWQFPVPWHKTTMVNGGKYDNQLKVICRGNSIYCTLNQYELINFIGEVPESNRLGIGICSDCGVICSFKDFQIDSAAFASTDTGPRK